LRNAASQLDSIDPSASPSPAQANRFWNAVNFLEVLVHPVKDNVDKIVGLAAHDVKTQS
jgi:hypothetical protein